MRAIVTGMIATHPVGGVAFDYGQYALGLERLGFDVYYLEDTGLPSWTKNPQTGGWDEDPAYGVEFLRRSLAGLSPTLGERWHFRAYDDTTYGLDAGDVAEIVGGADVLLNVSGGCLLREEYRRCPTKVFIDTDPGWNHFSIFPRWDDKVGEERLMGFRGHDHFFTFADRAGKPDCPLPSFGLPWRPTRHPVIPDLWDSEPPGERYTTVMMWNNFKQPVIHDGVAYGSKEAEFGHIEAVPRHLPDFPFEVSVAGEGVPRERWRSLGWSVAGHEKSASAGAYRSYVAGSRGEFSVAKNIYVATKSGWFSGRTACYLAAGRPAIVQDTGFSEILPTGAGLLPFSNLDGAVRAVESVEDDYEAHSRAARELARSLFSEEPTLGKLLTEAGVG